MGLRSTPQRLFYFFCKIYLKLKKNLIRLIPTSSIFQVRNYFKGLSEAIL